MLKMKINRIRLLENKHAQKLTAPCARIILHKEKQQGNEETGLSTKGAGVYQHKSGKAQLGRRVYLLAVDT